MALSNPFGPQHLTPEGWADGSAARKAAKSVKQQVKQAGPIPMYEQAPPDLVSSVVTMWVAAFIIFSVIVMIWIGMAWASPFIMLGGVGGMFAVWKSHPATRHSLYNEDRAERNREGQQ